MIEKDKIEDMIQQKIEEILKKESVDLQENQRYHSKQILIANLNEEEWQEMKKNGAKELHPYFNEKRNTWHIALSLGYDENHRRIRKIITGKSKEEVYQKYFEFRDNNKVLEEEKTNETSDKSHMLFKDYMKSYIEMTRGVISDKSLVQKEIAAKRIVEVIGENKLYELDNKMLAKCINQIALTTFKRGGEEKYYSQEVINKAYIILKGCITSAFDEGIYKKNPMERVKRPTSRQVTSEKKNKPLPDAKIAEIMKATEKNLKWNIFFSLLIATGGRPSEILALKFEDINFETKTVKITKALTASIKKEVINGKEKKISTPIIGPLKNDRGGKNIYARRKIKLSEKLLDKIKEYEISIKNDARIMSMRVEQKTEGFLFTGSKDQKLVHYQTHRKAFLSFLKSQNIDMKKYTIYSTRHTFCVNNIKSGADTKSLQILMGDKTLNMIMEHYADIEKEYVLKHNEKYNEYTENILEKYEDINVVI